MTSVSGPVRIAIDIGGTFTDLQILEEASGRTLAFKTPTTPGDPSEGLMAGIGGAAAAFGFGLDQVSGLMHGTTIATNAVLERKLPVGALVTTSGFEDVLEIGRHVRKDIYGMRAEPRTLLIERANRFGVAERVTARGAVERALDADDAGRVADAIAASGAEVVAVCLLHAYANPAHERRLGEIIAERCGNVFVSLSSTVSPEIREFERTSTTALNALLMPVVGRYLERLRARMADAGFAAPVYLVQSNGGVTTPEIAAEQPARLLLSGPSGGALAAETIARNLNKPNLIAVDMGGTSFDVSIVHGGRTRIVTQGEVDDCPVRLPMVEIRTIGAGGGSIAWTDAAGSLQVGPQSAGADPGPVAYGRGGTEPTVTDANVALGRIDPDYFLGGATRLDAETARAALQTRIAGPLSLGLEEAAEGILKVATAHMATAIRLSLFEKGLDPKDFALVSFGGAGGLHAIDVAAELGATRVIFPRDPGTLSAWGMLFSDVAHDLAAAKLLPATRESVPVLAEMAARLEAEGADLLARDGVAEAQRDYRLAADLRYRGQAYEILVPWPGEAIDASTLAGAVRDFHALHMAQYAHADEAAAPEIVALRLTALGRLAKPAERPFEAAGAGGPKGRRRLYLDGGWQDAAVYDRETLPPAAEIAGPAIVEEAHSTILLPGGWRLTVANTGDLLATVAA